LKEVACLAGEITEDTIPGLSALTGSANASTGNARAQTGHSSLAD